MAGGQYSIKKITGGRYSMGPLNSLQLLMIRLLLKSGQSLYYWSFRLHCIFWTSNSIFHL